jgi:hypothetical protein
MTGGGAVVAGVAARLPVGDGVAVLPVLRGAGSGLVPGSRAVVVPGSCGVVVPGSCVGVAICGVAATGREDGGTTTRRPSRRPPKFRTSQGGGGPVRMAPGTTGSTRAGRPAALVVVRPCIEIGDVAAASAGPARLTATPVVVAVNASSLAQVVRSMLDPPEGRSLSVITCQGRAGPAVVRQSGGRAQSSRVLPAVVVTRA